MDKKSKTKTKKKTKIRRRKPTYFDIISVLLPKTNIFLHNWNRQVEEGGESEQSDSASDMSPRDGKTQEEGEDLEEKLEKAKRRRQARLGIVLVSLFLSVFCPLLNR